MSDDSMDTMYEFSEDIGEATPPPPLPVNQYDGEIRSVEGKVSTNTGKRYAAVHVNISPDSFPADYEAAEEFPEGMTLIYRRVPLEDDRASRARLRQFLEAIGAPTGKSIDLNDWIGLSARWQLNQSEWEGQMRNEIVGVSASN